jgi:NAD(P)H dehydrogenase (quinone)
LQRVEAVPVPGFCQELPQDSGKSYVIQHLKEVAIDHDNGIDADTNSYIADIGGRQPMTVEEFVNRNREAFV